MRFKSSKRRSLWDRHKKKIILIGVTLLALFTLVLGGMGYALYQTAVFAKESLSSSHETQGDDAVVLPQRGWIEGFVISVGSLWLQQNIAGQDTAQLKNGLSCFDALGGPSPVEMVNIVKSQVKDARITQELDTLTQGLQADDPAQRGPAACASWMLNG